MNPFLGVIFHAVGGFAAGSFYMPFYRVRGWPWEVFWLIGGFFAWLIVPTLVTLLTINELVPLLSTLDGASFFWPYFFGVLWGIGGLTFGLTMRYLGMSLGMSFALGLTAVFGTLVPPVFSGQIMEVMTTVSGRITLFGILIGIAGIMAIGYAGFLKDRQLDISVKTSAIREFNLKKGIVVAITSGILSACFAFGIASGKPLVNATSGHLEDPLFANSLLFSVIMAGGLTTNLLYCAWLWFRNKSWRSLSAVSTRANRSNLIFCALAGTTWYCQFLFYGMGTTQMGRYDFVSWSLHMSFIIMFSNIWGIIRKEWKAVRQATVNIMLYGILILLISTMIIGYGNSVSGKLVAFFMSVVLS